MFDTERLAMPAFLKAGKQIGITMTEEIYMHVIGTNLRKTAHIISKKIGHPLPVESFLTAYYDEYEKIIEEKGIPLKPGLIELLTYLKESKIRRCVVTSTKTEFALKKLTLTKVLEYFEFVIGGDQVNSGKPNPEPYLLALQKLAFEARNCLVLEDSNNGIQSAYAASLRVIAIPDLVPLAAENQNKPFKILQSLHEVKDFLETQ